MIAASLSCSSSRSDRGNTNGGGNTDASGSEDTTDAATHADAEVTTNVTTSDGGTGTGREAVHVAGDYFFGAIDELSDWVAFANQVALVTVVDETVLPEPPEAKETGQLLPRVVTLRVDKSLWEPEDPDIVRIGVGEEVAVDVFGWVYVEEGRLPTVAASAVRVEVGGQYLMPLVKFDRKRIVDGVTYTEGWAPLTAPSVVPAKGSAIAQDDADRHGADAPLVVQLRDRDPEDVAEDLAALPPDPRGDEVRHLAGAERALCYFDSTCVP
jgi:hypothetical protein